MRDVLVVGLQAHLCLPDSSMTLSHVVLMNVLSSRIPGSAHSIPLHYALLTCTTTCRTLHLRTLDKMISNADESIPHINEPAALLQPITQPIHSRE